jgi:hemolysin III
VTQQARTASTLVKDEIANSLTHGFGLLLSLAGLPAIVGLAYKQGGTLRVIACTVFAASLVVLYASSTLYHAFRTPALKRVFHICDHSAIYLLIAGTYTPFTLISLHGPWGWSLFGVIWGMGILGVIATAIALDIFQYIAPAVFVIMGWLVLIAAKPLLASVSTGGILWLLAGGIAYTSGLIFFGWERLQYHHAIWHCFVLMGSICHFKAVVVAVAGKAI